MKMMKRTLAAAVGLAMLAGLGACGGSRSGDNGSGSEAVGKGATIGVSMPTKSEERWNKDGNNLKSKLEKAGYKVVLSFADDKPAQQNADIENMVNKGAKIVVVASKDGTAVGPAVEKAKDAGAKVIAYDRLIMNTKAVDYYATFQLERTGVLEAQWLIDQLGLESGAKGPFNVELFTGSPDDNNAKYFFKGAWDLLQPYFKSGVLVSPSQHGGGVNKDFKLSDWQKISVQSWKTEQAQKDMESILDSTYAHGEKLDAVLSPYDGISQGVINAIQSKRPDMQPNSPNWPKITGQDAMEISVANISKGLQGQTVFKDVNKLADAVYDMIIELAEGKKVSGLNGKFNNNTIEVPSKLLDPKGITKENLTDLVKANYLTQDRFDQLTK
ncbi:MULTISPECIES: substrate-binding domain-containing protein [Bifidobacterium]|uniref:Sugar ABC superfamily ATP binding cassette transporter, binding protein n=1 Tax=Bifidobacterium [indicum] DSM 20214 = LMG 11587 TaxID=1341694 RepID=A0A087VUE1_9BIFI|nr:MULTISPECIES: sugar-binding protein [Bifidobacterium]MCT6877684.1 sugar-binding protein [Bifidobacteriales bacterium]AIC91939.1 sugar ABC superfamily ATP binding cassette transporter, binding protein [Bifidobacterium indicum LMG 11587 = DSM 20214]MBH9978809.1 sugar-binding protein [Bifidobacterium sp. W8108]MBI0173321.1 sugar-binding protein [Bifidobacterium sp. M0307]PXY80287.1 ABC transporter substrate-binding protein [Bifidobacterium indicum]